MTKEIIIRYHVIENSVEIDCDMSTFEAFGVIEAAKAMIMEKWLKETRGEE